MILVAEPLIRQLIRTQVRWKVVGSNCVEIWILRWLLPISIRGQEHQLNCAMIVGTVCPYHWAVTFPARHSIPSALSLPLTRFVFVSGVRRAPYIKVVLSSSRFPGVQLHQVPISFECAQVDVSDTLDFYIVQR